MKLFDVFKCYRIINQLMLSKPPELHTKSIKDIVNEFINKRQLYIDIFQKEKSPVYILDQNELVEKAKLFQKTFRQYIDNTEFYYAVKSNNYPGVSDLLVKNNFGLDVSSGVELQMALDLKAEKIVFSGPGKTDEELLYAVRHSKGVIILADSVNELIRLNAIAEKSRKTITVGIRIHTAKSGLWKKFGIHIDELMSAFNEIRKLQSIKFAGLQFHSSWNLTPDNHACILKKLGETFKACSSELAGSIEFIDIGGGYWPPEGEWLHYSATPFGKLINAIGIERANSLKHYCYQSHDISSFAQTIAATLKANIYPYVKCKIFLEPGRWVCNNSMQFLFSVVDKKSRNIVIADAGTNAIGWERFEQDYFPVINLSKPELKERLCNIYGSLCTPHDIWGYSYWGASINNGDILIIPMQGAYTYSLRQAFIKPVPNVVVI